MPLPRRKLGIDHELIREAQAGKLHARTTVKKAEAEDIKIDENQKRPRRLLISERLQRCAPLQRIAQTHCSEGWLRRVSGAAEQVGLHGRIAVVPFDPPVEPL